jgi:hypothetical protein
MYSRFKAMHDIDVRINPYAEPLQDLRGVLTDANVNSLPAVLNTILDLAQPIWHCSPAEGYNAHRQRIIYE